MTIHPTSSINTAGALGTSFDTDGKANYNTAGVSEVGEYVLIDMVGNIVITGTQGNDIIVARFTKNGALDTTWFDGDGIVTTNFGGTETSFGLAIQPDGKIIAAGGSSGDFALARYLSGTNEHTFHTYDANYNVTASIGRYGVILERYTYTPYGKRTVIDEDWSSDTDGLSDVKNNFGHQGGMIDNESGLMKFRNRDYHASLGNWIERDPLGLADGMNLFAYVRGRPTMLQDPTGLIGTGCPTRNCSNCWQTCASTAGQALLGGLYGIVICRPDGCKCACVNETLFPPTSDPGAAAVRDCIIAHEEFHIHSQPSWVTTCNCPNNTLCAATHTGNAQDIECEASAAEWACLCSKKATCNGDTTCLDKIIAGMHDASNYCTSKGGNIFSYGANPFCDIPVHNQNPNAVKSNTAVVQ